MKKVCDFFYDEELGKKVYEDFKDKLQLYKLQVNVLMIIIDNLHYVEVETGIPIYDFTDEDSGVSITDPFTECSGRFEVNPFEEYGDQFLNSNYIELVNKIKENVNDTVEEETIIEFIKKTINENVEKIKEESKKYTSVSENDIFDTFEIGTIKLFEEK